MMKDGLRQEKEKYEGMRCQTAFMRIAIVSDETVDRLRSSQHFRHKVAMREALQILYNQRLNSDLLGP